MRKGFCIHVVFVLFTNYGVANKFFFLFTFCFAVVVDQFDRCIPLSWYYSSLVSLRTILSRTVKASTS